MRNLTRLLTLGWIVLQMAMLSGCRTPPIDWDKIGGPPTPPTADDVVGIWEGTAYGEYPVPYVRVELWPDGRGILSTCGIRRTSALVFEISWTLSDGELTWRDVKSGYGVFRGFPHSQEMADQGFVTSRLRMVQGWYGKTEYVFIREDHLEQMRGTVRRELEDFRRSLAGGPATNHPPAPQPPVTAHPVEDK